MVELALGVVDLLYSDSHGSSSGAQSTGAVAEILESRYHVLEIFYELNQDFIAEQMAQAMEDEIDDLVNGKPPSSDPLYGAHQRIEARFRAWLDSNEIQTILPLKLQVNAAKVGKNSRKKSGKNKGGQERAAFVDTGQYQSAFRAWLAAKSFAE